MINQTKSLQAPSGAWNGHRDVIGSNGEFGSYNTKSSVDFTPSALTEAEYRTLQSAYDYFNRKLFGGSLPQVLITLQRHPGARGFFSPERFKRRDAADRVHELALNPDCFTGRSDQEILSTLVHEMSHVWQEEYGERGRGRYHNREWARKMHSIGLMASDTGEPGGAPTGDSVSHYILDDRPFAKACSEFLEGAQLSWETAIEDGLRNAARGATRTKFTCPICGDNVWAKPSAEPVCGRCSLETSELIPMISPGQPQPARRRGAAPKCDYDKAIEILTGAVIKAKASNIALEDFLPPLLDVTAAVALSIDGEEAVRAAIARLESRIADWRAGTFPVNGTNQEAAR
jgi:hypothetical protein